MNLNILLDEYKIPKNTIVFLHADKIMHKTDVFDDPETFKPERFLDSNGNYISTRHPGFIIFGMGRRSCPGEKLALAHLFLIMVNLLQSTIGYEFVLPNGPGSVSLEHEPISPLCLPFDFSISLKKVKS